MVEVFVGHADGFGLLAHIAVGLARIGVLLLDDGWNAQPVGGLQGRATGKTTHANHHIGLEAPEDAYGFGHAANELERQAQRRSVLGEPADPQPFNAIARLGHALHLHAALGSDKQNLSLRKPPLQGIGNGNGGKNVAARASTANHDFQVLFHLQWVL